MNYRTIIINGIPFEVIRSRHTRDRINKFIQAPRKTLYDAYDKPSKAKIEIYEDWRSWYCNSDDVYGLSVISYSTQTFTLGAIYCDDEIDGYIKITKSHNYLYI